MLVVRRPVAGAVPSDTQVCVIPRDDVPEKALEEAVAKATYALPRAHFTKQGWTLEPPDVVSLLEKIRRQGAPLKEVAGVSPQYGMKTGFNKAFLIDTATRDRLIADDRSAASIILPYLRGQDVGRWCVSWPGLWMIFARRGIDIDAYPSVKRHLELHRDELTPCPANWQANRPGEKWQGRKEGTYAWYELQDAVDYWEDFTRPKIIYQVIQFHSRFALDTDGRLSNDKTFILPTDDPWLLAVLNSPLMWWHNWRFLTHLKDEALSPMGYRVEVLPIAVPNKATKAAAAKTVAAVIAQRRTVLSASAVTLDWLRHEFGLEKPSRELSDVTALDVETFISAVRDALPRSRRLTAAEIGELKREHVTTVEPTRRARGEIIALERKLSDLVNAAYGLTAEEVELMWRTAPPRMPLSTGAQQMSCPDDEAGVSDDE